MVGVDHPEPIKAKGNSLEEGHVRVPTYPADQTDTLKAAEASEALVRHLSSLPLY